MDNIVLYITGGVSVTTLALLMKMSFQMGQWTQKVEDLENRVNRLEGRRKVTED
jgi:hypothetical protein